MAMRITTKMMQNTSLRNLNTNKSRQEKLTNQLATGKKITRPSDDPVVAIRALKLNASLDKIEQYYEKNAEDAQSWLDLTSSSISTVNDILDTTIRPNINQAISSYLKVEDRKAIITNLTNAVEEIYSTGNADSGGRSIFTGYRTDMPLTIKEDKTELNTITEQLTNEAIGKTTFVATGDLKSINEGNFNDIDTKEFNVATNDVYRIRLSYGDADIEPKVDANGNTVVDAKGNTVYTANVDIGYMTDANLSSSGKVTLRTGNLVCYVSVDATGIPVEATFETQAGAQYKVKAGDSPLTVGNVTYSYDRDGTLKIVNQDVEPTETVTFGTTIKTDVNGNRSVEYDDKYKTSLEIANYYPTASDDAAYQSVLDNPDEITYIADTGEILFGTNVQKKLSELSSDTELRVTYDKSEWKENDLDPVHYFYTERTDSTTKRTVKYNENFLDDPSADGKQIIEYDIGNNQTIRVNTTADELFTHDMGRDVSEVVDMLNEYGTLEENLSTVQDMIDSEKYVDDDLTKLEEHKAALEKAMTYVGDKINKRCSELLTNCDNYLENTELAETNCGSRGTRLNLVKNRLSVQKTNYEELVSENEDADYTDLAVQLKSVEMTYEAALSSISYVMQTSLLDFI
jgi:flagellar hook-associated protein 3 FlgL